MRITTILFAIAAFAFVVSCGKATPESETNRWEASKRTLEGLGAKYQGIKPALEVLLTESTVKWEAALAIGDAEKQIEAMRAANSAISPSFVNKLDKLPASIEKLRDMIAEATQATSDADIIEYLTVMNTTRDAKQTLADVEGELAYMRAATPGEAEGLVSQVVTKVEGEVGRMTKVIETINAKKQSTQAAADTAAAKAEADAKKPIKCSSCSSMNEHDALKCGSCGAPIEK